MRTVLGQGGCGEGEEKLGIGCIFRLSQLYPYIMVMVSLSFISYCFCLSLFATYLASTFAATSAVPCVLLPIAPYIG